MRPDERERRIEKEGSESTDGDARRARALGPARALGRRGRLAGVTFSPNRVADLDSGEMVSAEETISPESADSRRIGEIMPGPPSKVTDRVGAEDRVALGGLGRTWSPGCPSAPPRVVTSLAGSARPDRAPPARPRPDRAPTAPRPRPDRAPTPLVTLLASPSSVKPERSGLTPDRRTLVVPTPRRPHSRRHGQSSRARRCRCTRPAGWPAP